MSIDIEALLAEMMAIPTVNPRGRAEPAETGLATWIADWATSHGMRAETQEVVDGRRNVIVTLPGSGPDTVLLETHLDTVEVEGMSVEPFTATTKNGRIYGRGSCDAKGPLAVFLAAMADVAAAGQPERTTVLAGVIDEEHQYKGVQEFRTRGLRPVGAIVGEPTTLRMVTAHKGCMRCVITATGPGGHSSEPWGKNNAIQTISEVVTYLSTEVASRLDLDVRPLVGPPSLAVTMIEGGHGPNILPDRAAITIDRRTVSGEDPHQVWRELADDLAQRWPEHLQIAEPHIVDYALHTESDDSFVASFSESLAADGLNPEAKGVGHGTDASKIALDGVPCVVFGPGSIEHAHMPDEFVPVDHLHTARSVVRRVLSAPGRAR